MLKKYIKTTCSFLATAGAFFFAGTAYSAGMTIGQPQYDVTPTGQPAAQTDTPMTVTSAPAGVAAQAGGSAKPSSPSAANADREVFREDAAPAK
jgi:hypothetical protein